MAGSTRKDTQRFSQPKVIEHHKYTDGQYGIRGPVSLSSQQQVASLNLELIGNLSKSEYSEQLSQCFDSLYSFCYRQTDQQFD